MVQKRENPPKPSFQVLPNNRIDKEVKEIVRSFNFPLRILLSSKYHVHDNHIYPNQNKWLLLFSFCRMLFFNCMCFYRTYSSLSKAVNSVGSAGDLLYIFVLLLFSLVHTFCLPMLFILDIVHKHNNVSLILKMQSIHRCIDFSTYFLSYLIWNWISIFITISADVFVFVCYYSSVPNMNIVLFFLNMYTDLSFFAFDINLTIASRVLVLLRKYLEEWIDDVLNMNDEEDNDEQCHKLLETYQNILEAYNLYNSIFQTLALFHVMDTFTRNLFLLDTLFKFVNEIGKMPNSMIGYTTIIWLVKSIALVVMQSLNCERFYTTVDEAQSTCIQLLKKRNCSKSQIRLCKSVILENRSFSKMSSCGLFDVDATLPISLLGHLTHYVLILLQFIFLQN